MNSGCTNSASPTVGGRAGSEIESLFLQTYSLAGLGLIPFRKEAYSNKFHL